MNDDLRPFPARYQNERNLVNANSSGIDLNGVNLKWSDIREASFTIVNLTGANLVGTTNADLCRSEIWGKPNRDGGRSNF